MSLAPNASGLSLTQMRQVWHQPPMVGERHDSPQHAVTTRTITKAEATSWRPHVDSEHELIIGLSGALGAWVGGHFWPIAAGSAFWIPAGIGHSVHLAGAGEFVCCWLSPAAIAKTWPGATALMLTPVARELLLEISRADSGNTVLSEAARQRAEASFLDFLGAATPVPVNLPLPDDVRLLRVAEAVLTDPSDNRTMEAWSALAGMSLRSFSRHFVEATGLGFSQWRLQARMSWGMGMLEAGVPPATVATRTGYGTSAAFLAAYKRVIGETAPGQIGRSSTRFGRSKLPRSV